MKCYTFFLLPPANTSRFHSTVSLALVCCNCNCFTLGRDIRFLRHKYFPEAFFPEIGSTRNALYHRYCMELANILLPLELLLLLPLLLPWCSSREQTLLAARVHLSTQKSSSFTSLFSVRRSSHKHQRSHLQRVCVHVRVTWLCLTGMCLCAYALTQG